MSVLKNDINNVLEDTKTNFQEGLRATYQKKPILEYSKNKLFEQTQFEKTLEVWHSSDFPVLAAQISL